MAGAISDTRTRHRTQANGALNRSMWETDRSGDREQRLQMVQANPRCLYDRRR